MICRPSDEVTESTRSAVRAASLSESANTVVAAPRISSITSESTTLLRTSGRTRSSRDRRSPAGPRRAHRAKRAKAWRVLIHVSYSPIEFARRSIACAHAWAAETLLVVSSRVCWSGRPSSSRRILDAYFRCFGQLASSLRARESTNPVRHPSPGLMKNTRSPSHLSSLAIT
jgi:hypothetical protein